jgi:predicted AAA+ superfamily ATPase
MLAHYHGQVWNSSEFARSFGVADTTVRRYLDLLSAAFVVRQLQPWHENLGKRQVRSPKVYVADPGLLHTLLGLEAPDDVLSHPKAGASWEGFALGVVAGHLCARSDQTWFWATHGGAELDLLVTRGRERRGFEFKLTDAPRVTRSMRSAIEDLHLDSLDVVHAGEETFPLGERIRGVALRRVPADVEP